jgi:dCTP deaminase
MSSIDVALFPDLSTEESASRTTGILPSQEIRELIAGGRILASPSIEEAHIQPASLDLRLGDIAHRVQASFLPGPNNTVESKIKDLRMARLDLTGNTVLEKDCVYIVPLLEELNLPEGISGKANPKSTTGRLDIFTRLITDYGVEFDRVPPGYKGKLYAEIVTRTFTVRVKAGMRLSQLRFVRGNPDTRDGALRKLDIEENLVYMDEDSPVRATLDRGLRITVSLEASEPGEIIAYRRRRTMDSFSIPATSTSSLPVSACACPLSSPPRWCLSIRRTASSGFITPASSIPDSGMGPATSRARARCSKSARTTCHS